jgi:hypothetical protein
MHAFWVRAAVQTSQSLDHDLHVFVPLLWSAEPAYRNTRTAIFGSGSSIDLNLEGSTTTTTTTTATFFGSRCRFGRYK